MHGHVPDGMDGFIPEEGGEGHGVVGGFPEAAGGGGHIEDRRIHLHHSQIHDPAAHDGGPDVPGLKPGEVLRKEGLASWAARPKGIAEDEEEDGSEGSS